MGGGSWCRTSEACRGPQLCSGVWYPSPHTTQVLFSTWTLVSGTWPSTMMEKKPKLCLSWRPPQVSELCAARAIETLVCAPHNLENTTLQMCSERRSFFFFLLQSKVQVNQGEDEYYKNQDVGVILSCLWVELWEIIISSLPWVSSEQITGPASGNHLHTIQYDCTILRVPFLIVICSNLHLLSIYQKGEDFFACD